jgi:flavin-dependent thymidylate synthase
MKVTLISCTPDAAALLLFTKNTRLNMTAGSYQSISERSPAEVAKELAYIAGTIPSSWEFVDYVFAVEGVSRAYTHQQVRTRAASYAQQSMRVLDMCEFDYVMTEGNLADPCIPDLINKLKLHISGTYKMMRALGQAPEDCRGILPTNIATNMICKFNLRTMSELCRSRTGGRTQSEYQQVLSAMAEEVIGVHPWAEQFLFPKGRDYFAEIEAFAAKEYGGDLLKKGELLKIVDKMRKEA